MSEPNGTQNNADLHQLFLLMPKFGASDVHLKVGTPPVFRIAGTLRNLDLPPVTAEQIEKLLNRLLDEEHLATLYENGQIDFAHPAAKRVRLRVNVFRQRGNLSLAARLVNADIPTFKDLHLPPETMQRIASHEQGFIIISGATGSGKSTSLAAIIEYINARRRCHIVTIEDPIEYLFLDNKAIINQREVGIDVPSFPLALKTVVRQDPDVILLGEMRDVDSFSAGLSASETGHLVFGTLHCATVSETFSRILDFFPGDRQQQIRTSLQFNLRAIICQKLLPSIKEGVPRVPALEIMLGTPPIQKAIENGEDDRIIDIVRSSKEEGMCDFNHSLYQLIQSEMVDPEVAIAASPNPQALEANLQGVFLHESGLK
jgi:twitching motility protein PilT